jgi:glutathione S-transferase
MQRNDVHSYAVSVIRLGRGWYATAGRVQPEQPLELFEFEACPYCRKVREVLTELDIAYVCRPCPKGSNNRKTVVERGGKALFPFLVDPNTGVEMYESEAIVTYLLERYGTGRPLVSKVLAPLNTAGATLASASRRRGRRALPEAKGRSQPDGLLELYNFEASPFCRKVRETLNELNLDHRVHSVGRGSARRPQLVALGGKMMVPYLVDPNTDSAMYESEDIIRYLHATYGAGA